LSTFFAIEFARQRRKIGIRHIDFYSSCKRTYNKRVTDQVTLEKDFLTSEVTITKKTAVQKVQIVQAVQPLRSVQRLTPIQMFKSLP
jgi:hypothetical protein